MMQSCFRVCLSVCRDLWLLLNVGQVLEVSIIPNPEEGRVSFHLELAIRRGAIFVLLYKTDIFIHVFIGLSIPFTFQHRLPF